MCFKEIKSFREIIDLAEEKIKQVYILNFDVKVKFYTNLIENVEFTDFSLIAQDFHKPECPSSLYMNHGSYIGKDGIPHVIRELKNKPKGNRSLISLISEKNIIGKGDDPIPSFMVLQFSIENNTELYATAYFRALEVSTFLKINIEEFRIIIKKIVDEIPAIKCVNLNIIAFKAYKDSSINTLKKPMIEQLHERKIYSLMLKGNKGLPMLIRCFEEKLKSNTVINIKPFELILEICKDKDENGKIEPVFEKKYFQSLLGNYIQVSKKLKRKREQDSQSAEIIELNKEVDCILKSLIEEVEKNGTNS